MSGLINSVRLGLIGELISTMKKIIGTKVKRYVAGSLAFVTAMIFSLPGNIQAQQAQQAQQAAEEFAKAEEKTAQTNDEMKMKSEKKEEQAKAANQLVQDANKEAKHHKPTMIIAMMRMLICRCIQNRIPESTTQPILLKRTRLPMLNKLSIFTVPI